MIKHTIADVRQGIKLPNKITIKTPRLVDIAEQAVKMPRISGSLRTNESYEYQMFHRQLTEVLNLRYFPNVCEYRRLHKTVSEA